MATGYWGNWFASDWFEPWYRSGEFTPSTILPDIVVVAGGIIRSKAISGGIIRSVSIDGNIDRDQDISGDLT